MIHIQIHQIEVNGRHRKDLGDIDALSASIRDLGLLQPVVVGPGNRLIAGERRLEACKRLGWSNIPAHYVANLSEAAIQLRAERDENTCRLDFAPDEAVAIGLALEELERPKAKERQSRPGKARTEKAHSGNLPEQSDTRDLVGAAVGMSGKTYEMAKEVVAAREEHPDLVEQMHKTRKVSRAFSELKRRQLKKKLNTTAAKTPADPSGKFDVLVIDPPWPLEKVERECRPNQVELDYPTMGEAELLGWRLASEKAADNCHVFLWTTQRFLPLTFECLSRWGFAYCCTFVWHKPGGIQPLGLPQFNCEFAIYAKKGSPRFLDAKSFFTCFQAPRGGHSEKPEEFYEVLRRVTAGRRLDMFNRRPIPGFIGWGKEAA